MEGLTQSDFAQAAKSAGVAVLSSPEAFQEALSKMTPVQQICTNLQIVMFQVQLNAEANAKDKDDLIRNEMLLEGAVQTLFTYCLQLSERCDQLVRRCDQQMKLIKAIDDMEVDLGEEDYAVEPKCPHPSLTLKDTEFALPPVEEFKSKVLEKILAQYGKATGSQNNVAAAPAAAAAAAAPSPVAQSTAPPASLESRIKAISGRGSGAQKRALRSQTKRKSAARPAAEPAAAAAAPVSVPASPQSTGGAAEAADSESGN